MNNVIRGLFAGQKLKNVESSFPGLTNDLLSKLRTPSDIQHTGLTASYFEKLLKSALEKLLNCSRPDDSMGLDDFPYVKDSVLNYGIIPVAGQSLTRFERIRIVGSVRQAILLFEPRIIPDSFHVEEEYQEGRRNHCLTLIISGAFYYFSEPQSFRFFAELDTECGNIEFLRAG